MTHKIPTKDDYVNDNKEYDPYVFRIGGFQPWTPMRIFKKGSNQIRISVQNSTHGKREIIADFKDGLLTTPAGADYTVLGARFPTGQVFVYYRFPGDSAEASEEDGLWGAEAGGGPPAGPGGGPPRGT